jgi:hypothetical protein
MRRRIARGSFLRLACSESRRGSPSPRRRSGRLYAAQRSLGGRAGLQCTFGRGATEQDQWTDELVFPLLGPPAKELDLLPLVGRLDAAPAPLRAHLRSPSPCCAAAALLSAAGTEGCHKRWLAASSVGGFGRSVGSALFPTTSVLLCVADFVARFGSFPLRRHVLRPAARKADDTVTGHVTGALLLSHAPPVAVRRPRDRPTGHSQGTFFGPADGWVRPIRSAARNHL